MPGPARIHRLRAPVDRMRFVVPATGSSALQINGKTYDWLNHLAGGSGAGAAWVDGPKDGGPATGVYLVAPGENTQSENVNRGAWALAENFDYHDDILHGNRPVPKLASFTVSGSPTTSVTVPAYAYYGPSGTGLSASNLQKYFRILTTGGDEVVDSASNEIVLVQTSDVAGGTSPTPPYVATTRTLTLNYALPVGSYVLLYSELGNLAEMGNEALLSPVLAGVARVSGIVQKVFRNLRGDGLGFTANWPASIQTLVIRGLNGLYRAATAFSALPATVQNYYEDGSSNEPGAGGAFLRDGPAMLGYSQTDLSGDSPYRDLFGSLWTAWMEDTSPGDGETAHSFVAGSRGFTSLGHRVRAQSGGTLAVPPTLGGFTHFVQHRDTFNAVVVATTAPTSGVVGSCTVQKVTGVNRVTISGGNRWFRRTISSVARSSLVRGWTLLEVSWLSANDPVTPGEVVRRLYRVMEFISDTTVRVVAVDGSGADFPAIAAAGSIVKVLTPSFQVPDGLGEVQTKLGHPDAALFESGSLVVLSLPYASTDTNDKYGPGQGAYFGASKAANTDVALAWGGFLEDEDAYSGVPPYSRTGLLRGDGSLSCTAVTCTSLSTGNVQCADIDAEAITASSLSLTGSLQCVTASVTTLVADKAVFVGGSVTIASGGSQALNLSSALGTNGCVSVVITGSNVVFTSITLPAPTDGSRIELHFRHTTGNAQISPGAWPSSAKFDQPSDALLSDVAGTTDHYSGVYRNGAYFLNLVRS